MKWEETSNVGNGIENYEAQLLPDPGKPMPFVVDARSYLSTSVDTGLYISVNSVRGCLGYFPLLATGCPHLQSKYAAFRAGHQGK